MEYIPLNFDERLEAPNCDEQPDNHEYQYVAEFEHLEIDSQRLKRQRKPIASGFFGKVYLGLLDGTTEVAIKTVKTAGRKTPEDFKKQSEERETIRVELRILAELDRHENIIQLFGAVTKNQTEFCIVLEYCKYKGLDSFLTERKAFFIDEIVRQKTNTFPTQYKSKMDSSWSVNYQTRRMKRHVSTSDILVFALQISRGLEYLQDNEILHRDLALRNMLLTEDFIIKIADFGLSRLTEDNLYHKEKNRFLPFKWLPIEALSSGPTPLKSDLWTFGIVLWELFTLHDEPYKGMNLKQYKTFIKSGKRLNTPEHAPMEMFEIMLKLWNEKPELRPPISNCQSVIYHELHRSCQPLAELHSQKHYECVIHGSDDDQGTNGAQNYNDEFIKMQDDERVSFFKNASGENVTRDSLRPAKRNKASSTQEEQSFLASTIDIRLQEKPESSRSAVFCSLRKISLVLVVLILVAIAAILIGYFVFQHIHVAKERTCKDLREDGETRSGIYSIIVNGMEPFNVFCDMETADGGWTVIQRRTNGNLVFWDKKWQDYKHGFGANMSNEFWLGLDKIHKLTVQDGDGNLTVTLRIDLWGDRCSAARRDTHCSGHPDGHWWGEWDFSIAEESEKYQLKISVAKAGNLTEHTTYDVFYVMNNKQSFSTIEVNNAKVGFNCAEFRHFGGWWHKDCSHVALNGLHSNQGDNRGFFWYYRRSSPTYFIHPVRSEMKIRSNY